MFCWMPIYNPDYFSLIRHFSIGTIANFESGRTIEPFVVNTVADRAIPSSPEWTFFTRPIIQWSGARPGYFIKTICPTSNWVLLLTFHFWRCCNWFKYSAIQWFQKCYCSCWSTRCHRTSWFSLISAKSWQGKLFIVSSIKKWPGVI